MLPDRDAAQEAAEALGERFRLDEEPQLVRDALAGEDDAEDAQWLLVLRDEHARLDPGELDAFAGEWGVGRLARGAVGEVDSTVVVAPLCGRLAPCSRAGLIGSTVGLALEPDPIPNPHGHPSLTPALHERPSPPRPCTSARAHPRPCTSARARLRKQPRARLSPALNAHRSLPRAPAPCA